MAKKKDDGKDPEERAEDFLANYQLQYSAMLTQAREAQETTSTTAWKTNYAEQRKSHNDRVKSASDAIKETLSLIQTEDTNEQAIKALSEQVKSLKDEHASYQAYSNRTIYPYKATAEACVKLLFAIRRHAAQEEEAMMLTMAGLAKAVADKIAKWPTVKWDDKHGAVIVNEHPDAKENEEAA